MLIVNHNSSLYVFSFPTCHPYDKLYIVALRRKCMLFLDGQLVTGVVPALLQYFADNAFPANTRRPVTSFNWFCFRRLVNAASESFLYVFPVRL